MLPDLKEVLEYRNPAVLKLYEQNHSQNKLSAEQAWPEMLKYLWLTQKLLKDQRENPNENLPEECVMLRSMQEVDDMWHEFILFTKDYAAFCDRYFGTFLHHLPNWFDNRIRTREKTDEEVRKILPYIYENLGEKTMAVWFASYLEEGVK